jgi:hypothetical protein
LGIAYALRPDTVIRTGWGRSYYQGTFGWTFNDLDADIYPSIVNQQIPAVSSFFPVQFVTGVAPSTPSIGTAPPLPVFPTIPASGEFPLPNGIGDTYIPVNQKIPYVDSYNFTVEHEFSNNMALSVGYVGNVARELNMGWNMNEPIPGPGPFTARQPYYALYGLTQTMFDKCDCESGNYNAFQTQFTKRFSNNLSLIVNYTWAKSLDYGEFGTPTDQYDTMLDYGPSSYNRSSVLTIGHTYFLPFGKGQRYASNAHGVLGQIISGWQWSGFTTWETGFPFSATLSEQASLNSEMSLRPNQIAGALAGITQSRNLWFNPASFVVPPLYQFGDAGKDAITGPPLFAADWALVKDFTITERVKMQFRWEVYNVFNDTNLANPSNTNVDTPTAGLITDVQSPMRNMQFGLHLTW